MTIHEVIDLLVKVALASYGYFVFDSIMDSFFNHFLGPDWRERINRYNNN